MHMRLLRYVRNGLHLDQVHTVDACFGLGLVFPRDTVSSFTGFSGCDLFTLGTSFSDQFFLGSSAILSVDRVSCNKWKTNSNQWTQWRIQHRRIGGTPHPDYWFICIFYCLFFIFLVHFLLLEISCNKLSTFKLIHTFLNEMFFFQNDFQFILF